MKIYHISLPGNQRLLRMQFNEDIVDHLFRWYNLPDNISKGTMLV